MTNHIEETGKKISGTLLAKMRAENTIKRGADFHWPESSASDMARKAAKDGHPKAKELTHHANEIGHCIMDGGSTRPHIKAIHDILGIKEEAGTLVAQIDTTLSDVVPGETGEVYQRSGDKSTAPTIPTGTSTDITQGKTGDKVAKTTPFNMPLAEAKSPSAIAGTRLISRHAGKDGHHAEVRYAPEWKEHSVHHYHDGKHLGEGPVSYHGYGKDGREDATDTAEYICKHCHVKDGKLCNSMNEGYSKSAVDSAIKSSRKKIGGKEGKMIHALLKGHQKEDEYTTVTNRDKKLEEAAIKILDKSVAFQQTFNESLQQVLRGEVSDEQRNDWIHVESGRLPFSDYINKYKV